jgi:hypothetical protein
MSVDQQLPVERCGKCSDGVDCRLGRRSPVRVCVPLPFPCACVLRDLQTATVAMMRPHG